jgi:hypothetical protein
MTGVDEDDDSLEPREPVRPPVDPRQPPPAIAQAQHAHLRRILWSFVALVVLLPVTMLGGAMTWLLLPLVAVAGLALREAIRLRRSVRLHGAARGR